MTISLVVALIDPTYMHQNTNNKPKVKRLVNHNLTKTMKVLLIATSMVLFLVSTTSYILSVYAQPQQGDGRGATASVANAGVSTLVFKGNSFFIQGNYMQAIRYYDKALAVDRSNKVALNNIGAAFIRLGNFSQAIQYYDKALDVDPNYKEALNDKGTALLELGNYSQAK